jgi:predicted O-methyltransferase YrrM
MSAPPEQLIGTDGYQWMAEQAAKMQTVVEVGCWAGAGTEFLLRACPGTVWAVDHWKGSPDPTDATHKPAKEHDMYAIFVKHVGHYPNLKILRMSSVEAAEHFADKSVDMVFIDAGHDKQSITDDLRVWVPKCNGLLCGHDFGHVPVYEALRDWKFAVSHHPSDIWSVQL